MIAFDADAEVARRSTGAEICRSASYSTQSTSCRAVFVGIEATRHRREFRYIPSRPTRIRVVAFVIAQHRENVVDWLLFLVIGVFALIAWRYIRHGGSIAGALLGGEVRRELGEVALSSGVLTSQVMRVLDMTSAEGERFIGLAVVSKAPMGVGMVAYRLDRKDARLLIALLQRASGVSAGNAPGMPTGPS